MDVIFLVNATSDLFKRNYFNKDFDWKTVQEYFVVALILLSHANKANLILTKYVMQNKKGWQYP